MLNLGRLRVLSEVASRGSLSAAADALGYTASAVSQQIGTLEREAGAPLFDRHARGVTLTEAGEVLLAHAARLLAGAQAARDELDELAHGDRGRVRVGWFTTAGAALVPRALARFIRDRPHIELALTEADPDESTRALRAGQLDLALIYQFELEDDLAPDLQQFALLEDPIYVGLAAKHPLAARDSLSLTDFADEPWVQGVGRGATLDALPAASRAAGFEPRIALRTDDHLVVQGLVAAGVGVALLPHIAIPTIRDDIALKRVRGRGLTREIRIARSPRHAPYHSGPSSRGSSPRSPMKFRPRRQGGSGTGEARRTTWPRTSTGHRVGRITLADSRRAVQGSAECSGARHPFAGHAIAAGLDQRRPAPRRGPRR